MMRTVAATVVILACAMGSAQADSLVIANPNQADFAAVGRDVTAAFDYPSTAPENHGITGLSVGAFGGATRIHNRAAYKALTGHDDDAIFVGGVQADKGLPGGWGVGAFLAGVGDNGITLYGARLHYALLEGTPITPSLVWSGYYTGAAGIDDFNYHAWGTDVTISQSLLVATPYAGVGYVWGRLAPRHGIALDPVHAYRAKGFVGIRFALLPLVHLGVEYDRLGSTNGLSLRVGMDI
ncbi:MAG TPA: hypothetical protein VFQ88_11145 [Nevskiaceae bacterium]|nr:hypothetical protein [Nevskiaceae bacterium]